MNSKRQSNIFHFKRFSVNHARASLKVGTDAVLLGAWTNFEKAKRILDVGTGCGVIALMLAQRTNGDATIDAVEIEPVDAEQARENVLQSPWPRKIMVHQKSIQEFTSAYKYDLIVSNPPFFVNSLLPLKGTRARARHTQTLRAEELIEHSLRLLNQNGRLSLILPVAEGNDFKAKATSRLHLVRQTAFFTRQEKPQERWLLEFSRELHEQASDQLVLYDSGDKKSDDYITLTKDFYL